MQIFCEMAQTGKTQPLHIQLFKNFTTPELGLNILCCTHKKWSQIFFRKTSCSVRNNKIIFLNV